MIEKNINSKNYILPKIYNLYDLNKNHLNTSALKNKKDFFKY